MKKQLLFVISFIICFSCKKKEPETTFSESYKTKNIIIVVVDGPRYSETWGDSTHQHIPKMASLLSKEGVTYTQFYNDGPTYTNAGHSAITTGNYQEINNSGLELPVNPSLFQYYLKQINSDSTQTAIITSKDKLEILANCTHADWKNKFMPFTNCGINGNGTGYRNDSITYKNTIDILTAKKPTLVLINFKEPDAYGHSGNWTNYLKGIKESDNYVYQLWNFIQNNSHYKNTTAFFVTNDHGRHLNGVADGFINHGDTCLGCRHINLFAAGPDFKKNIISDARRNQVDIPATVAKLLNIQAPTIKGQVMDELFLKQ